MPDKQATIMNYEFYIINYFLWLTNLISHASVVSPA